MDEVVDPRFSLGPVWLDRVFPFHFVVDEQLRICQAGVSLVKMARCELRGLTLLSCFKVPLEYPNQVVTFSLLLSRQGSTLKLGSLFNPGLILRGELQKGAHNELFFLGAPVINALSDLVALGLSYADFAAHDLSLEYALELKARQSIQKDMQELVIYIKQEKNQLETTLTSITDALIIVGIDGYIHNVSDLAVQLFSCDVSHLVGRSIEQFLFVNQYEEKLSFRSLLNGDKYIELPSGCYLLRGDGGRLSVKGNLSRIKVDMAEEVDVAVQPLIRTRYVLKLTAVEADASLESRLRYLSEHDDLTGLKNRRYFLVRLHKAINIALESGQRFSILFIDCNGFKQINDHYGHLVGDKLLAIIGNRLASQVKGGDIVCRYGGDEFLMLINNGMVSMASIVERIHKCFESPCVLDGFSVSVDVSVGVSCFPLDGDNAASLINVADVRMYREKNSTKS